MICLKEPEVEQARNTLMLLMAVHSPERTPEVATAALGVLKAEGAMDAASAEAVLRVRLFKLAEMFL